MAFVIKRLALTVATFAFMSWLGCGGGGAGQSGTGGATGGVSAATGGAPAESGGASGHIGTGAGGEAGSMATAGTGGQSSGTGGGAGAGLAGGAGAVGMAASAGHTGGSAAGTSGALHFKADRIVITGVRGTSSPAAAAATSLVDVGSTAIAAILTRAEISQVGTTFMPSTQDAKLTALTGGSPLVQITNPMQSMVTVSPGSDLAIVAALSTTGTALPNAPPQDSGATVLTATLTATTGSSSIQIPVYGLILTQALWEPTLGEILFALGYKLNVGLAQNNSNPNRGKTPQQLPGVETGTDELAAPLFKKVGSGPATLTPVARFSPVGALPFGWYPSTMSSKRNMVGTLAQATDAQTSDKARMVLPPLAAGGSTTFDPGPDPFGLWVFTGEASTNGNPSYGDYAYSQDSLNSPGGCHRFKAYPLRDAAGMAVPNTFLLAVEEAANGDYQDYVFVLGNVSVAP